MRLATLFAAPALTLALLAASPAAAQFLGPQTGVKPEQVAAAAAEADALIKDAKAEDYFDNVTVGLDPRVRHRRSGLVCSFTPGAELNKIMLFEGGPKGDDVGCNTEFGDMTVTHYATRYAEAYSPEFLAEDAGQAIRDRWPDAKPYPGLTADSNEEGNPPTSAVRFQIGDAGALRYTHALTARIGDWSFKQRMTSPADKAMGAQVIAGTTWQTVLRLARTKPGKDDI